MFTVVGNEFMLDGKEMKVYSGAIHYFRTVPEQWRDRLLKLKLAGFNTVETYVAWNMHEPKKGEFDFSGILDIERFLKIAQEVGLYAIVRPGPYICSEWDFGGLPAWLLQDRNMKLRCYYEPYLAHVKDFYEELLRRLVPLQITNGGNIIFMQVENEYGSYSNDKKYLRYIEKLMRDCGVDTLLMTSDGDHTNMLSGGTLPDVLKTVNFGSNPDRNFKNLRKIQPEGPIMCCEFWNGWFDHWEEKHHTRGSKSMMKAVDRMLEIGASFNFYMFHGGTNFGFGAGANHGGKYEPTVTSYDYDTLLTEWGDYTQKYHDVRKRLLAVQNLPEETLPAPAPKQVIGTINMSEQTGLFENLDNLAQRHESAFVESMEYFGQNYGLILYRHTFNGKYAAGRLRLDDLHDRAFVYLNGKKIATQYRNDKKKIACLLPATKEGDVLEILVDAMGRVNYGPELYDRKGLSRVRLEYTILSEWEIFTLPLDNLEKTDFNKQSQKSPYILRANFIADKQDDCFVDIRNFKKGYVYINGFNLGRYWKVGPQQALYLPGPLLKKGENELLIVELEGYSKPEVTIDDQPRLSKKKFLFFK